MTITFVSYGRLIMPNFRSLFSTTGQIMKTTLSTTGQIMKTTLSITGQVMKTTGQIMKATTYACGNLTANAIASITADDRMDNMLYGATQFGEGFKNVVTFPVTLIKMPFNRDSAQLLGHTIYYSVICYALPVLTYNGLLREPLAAGLSSTLGDSILFIDILMSFVFLRSAMNAYAMNAVTNINSSMVILDPDKINEVAKCDVQCSEENRNKAKWISPFYDLGKNYNGNSTSNIYVLGAPIHFVLKNIPFIGEFGGHVGNFISSGLHLISPVGTYLIKPLAWGEGIAEIKMSGLCADHRAEYFARNIISSLGMGTAALLWIHGLTYYGLGSMTGIESIWLEDAMFTLLFPLMVFHMHNQVKNPLIEPSSKTNDFFSGLKDVLDTELEKSKNFIVPKILRLQDGTFIADLKHLWRTPGIRYTRQFLLYPSLQSPHAIVRVGPINFMIRKKAATIDDGINTVELLVNHKGKVGVLLWFKSILRISGVDQQRQIFYKLNHKPKQTLYFVGLVRELLEHALKEQDEIVELTWENQTGKFTARNASGHVKQLPPAKSVEELRDKILAIQGEDAIKRLEAEFEVISDNTASTGSEAGAGIDGAPAPTYALTGRKRSQRTTSSQLSSSPPSDLASLPQTAEEMRIAALRQRILATTGQPMTSSSSPPAHDLNVESWLRDSVEIPAGEPMAADADKKKGTPVKPLLFLTPPSSPDLSFEPVADDKIDLSSLATALGLSDSDEEQLPAEPPFNFTDMREALPDAEEGANDDDSDSSDPDIQPAVRALRRRILGNRR